VFDEAHQSIARTYRRITEELTLDFRCALLGLTATPGRTWADIDKDGELAAFFAGNKVTLEVPSEDPIEYLIDNGFLARPRFRTLLAEPGLDVNERELARISDALDIPDEIVAGLSMSEQYVTAVLRAIQELLATGHRRVLVFAATVPHARVLTAVLVARNVRSEVVTGSTPVRVRERAIRTFMSDDEAPMVLVNFGVLTTGFDAPKATAAVIARPTKSLVLYSQMVGRAIRGPKAGGTETCEVVTVVDPRLPGFGDVAAAFLNWEDAWQ
jgi:superfamily II DNA or RNA helicase